ncbi:hypothetical protein ATZ33_06580 [Enterococcus silesiacus]|uniref:NERD domain-containing protein n=1 Tax=Enterococcus silesiacus TaxID=332949 RepID=A0A0S3K9Y2_9ENTE|nr:hypothetical protein [Enterococcus silesiacus]ALS01044.1 hypothetical protein ATZ33_06580 [Enterococcus silesiacus]OJG91729.1 hypothetical protein RV15_GL000396 [Enterococcus silesiacus]
MFDKISLKKLKNNTGNTSINLDVDYFIKYFFTNIMYINLKGEIDLRYISNSKDTYLPIFQKYGFTELFTNFDTQLIHTNLMEAIEVNTLNDLNIKKEKSNLEKQEAYDILNELEKSLNNQICKELLEYDRETCLQTLYTFSGILSYVSLQNKYWDDESAIAKNHLNFVTELFNTKYAEKKFEFDNYTGELKKSIEYAIHFVLNSEQSFKDSNKKKMDFPKLAALIILYIDKKEYKYLISQVYKEGGCFEFTDRIFLSEKMAEKINHLMANNSEVLYPITRSESLNIYNAFSKEYGYSPQFLEDYLFNYDAKFLNTLTVINLIEVTAFIKDIQNKTGQNEVYIKSMLDEITLSPIDMKDIYAASFSPKNRLFRTPLIKIGGYYLLSYWILSETSQYFKYRILKNQLSFTISKKIRNMITNDFDEFELITLKDIIKTTNLPGDINFQLNNNVFTKKLFENKKNLPQEIDFYVIKNKNLYIMEMKNNDLNRSLKNVQNDIHNVLKGEKAYLTKLKNLKKVMNCNKQSMVQALNGDFDKIHFFITFNNPHYLANGYDFENDVTVCSTSDFTAFISQMLS